MRSIVLLFDDFRLTDHEPLTQALSKSEQVALVYVVDPKRYHREVGEAKQAFMIKAIEALGAAVVAKGGYLNILKGCTVSLLTDLASQGFTDVFMHESVGFESRVEVALKATALNCHSFKGRYLVTNPSQLLTATGEVFKVFTPFWKAALLKGVGKEIVYPAPSSLAKCVKINHPASTPLSPLTKRWQHKIVGHWTFSETAVWAQFEHFCATHLPQYSTERNVPFAQATSELSAYLSIGVISPNQLYNALKDLPYAKQFIAELGWREFAYYTYRLNENLYKESLKPQYDSFEWDNNLTQFERWKQGETGVPLVDAGMKELFERGVMHNRVRMVAASYLIKNLLIDWRWGEAYFAECLVDFDRAINPFSWQWVFGSGYDASPYFRIFNPELQMQKFDPTSGYIHKWLGKHYTAQLIDLTTQRALALKRYHKALGTDHEQ